MPCQTLLFSGGITSKIYDKSYYEKSLQTLLSEIDTTVNSWTMGLFFDVESVKEGQV